MLLTQWRGIFIVLMLYGVLALVWSALRMPKPCRSPNEVARDTRRARRLRQTVTNRQTLGYALAAAAYKARCSPSCSSQQIFTEVFKLGHYFPLAFAAIAIGVAVAGFSIPVSSAGSAMRVFRTALVGFVVVAGLMLVAAKAQMLPLPLFMALRR